MADKNNISRKNFIKGCSATLGLMSVGLPDLLAAPTNKPRAFYKSERNGLVVDQHATIRGSWIRVGNVLPGDIALSACHIVVSKTEHSAVQQAARFLMDDIAKISGYQPPISERADNKQATIILTTVDSLQLPKDINTDKLKGKKEAYQIFTKDNTVWLIGSDYRGTAYAAYTLSERLGIDPLYLWTGYKPQRNANLILKKTDHYVASPTVKYRGFFHDDEDILPRPFDKFGYPLRIGDVPLEWYQRYFETALRLRMNTVAPYVRVHRRYEVQKCASDWGLYFTSHHYDILLSNPFGIERFFLAERRGVSTDWDWYKNKENMIKYWRGGVEENKHLSCIWPVGLRGTDDHAYEFPKNTPDQEQARVFKESIDIQVKAVKELIPANEKPIFHFTLYTEMLEKYRKHPEDFNVPEDVILVWPDNNDGVMRDLPNGHDKWKHGVYYHLSYFGGPPTKQGPHIVSPAKIAGEFKRIVDAGATEFMLVNVTELREYVMEARMIADICWDAPAVLNKPNPAATYVEWWAQEYFSGTADIVAAYNAYYELLNGSEKTYYGANIFETVLDKLYKRFTKQAYDQPDQQQINDLKNRSEKYDAAMHIIDQVYPKLNREQKQFFFEHVEFGLRVDQRPTQATLSLFKALAEPDDTKAWDHIAEAAVPLEKLEIEILRAERPPFEKWYQATWIKTPYSPFNVHRSYTQIREFITDGGTQTPINKKTGIGHNIDGARLWARYLEDAERIKAAY
jgi:hypothetical protein